MATGTIKNLLNLQCILKSTDSGKTATVQFGESGTNAYALVFGRFGYDSTVMSLSIISHPSSGAVAVQNFGTQNLSVSCTNDVVTITAPQPFAQFWVLSPVQIA